MAKSLAIPSQHLSGLSMKDINPTPAIKTIKGQGVVAMGELYRCSIDYKKCFISLRESGVCKTPECVEK